jgi:hypothetical protein
MKVLRGRKAIAPLSLSHQSKEGWIVNTTTQLLHHEERDPVPIIQETGWVPGQVWMGMENLTPTTIQFLVCPAHSKSLN